MIRLLDLYCGAGGCAMGYYLAAQDLGIEIQITGIDVAPQPNYPFQFVQADAVEYCKQHGHEFTHIHASPPCQKYSRSTAKFRKKGYQYSDLVELTRVELEKLHSRYVIENVPGAPITPHLRLRGDMFGLKVLRLRWFELGRFFMLQPSIPNQVGSVKEGDYVSVFGKGSYRKSNKDKLPKFKKDSVISTWKYAMGINWMKTDRELAESIPPAYTRFIGHHFFIQ